MGQPTIRAFITKPKLKPNPPQPPTIEDPNSIIKPAKLIPPQPTQPTKPANEEVLKQPAELQTEKQTNQKPQTTPTIESVKPKKLIINLNPPRLKLNQNQLPHETKTFQPTIPITLAKTSYNSEELTPDSAKPTNQPALETHHHPHPPTSNGIELDTATKPRLVVLKPPTRLDNPCKDNKKKDRKPKSNTKASSDPNFDIKDFLKKKKAERDARMSGSGGNLQFKNSCKSSHSLQHSSSDNARAHDLPVNVLQNSDAAYQANGEDSSQK